MHCAIDGYYRNVSGRAGLGRHSFFVAEQVGMGVTFETPSVILRGVPVPSSLQMHWTHLAEQTEVPCSPFRVQISLNEGEFRFICYYSRGFLSENKSEGWQLINHRKKPLTHALDKQRPSLDWNSHHP